MRDGPCRSSVLDGPGVRAYKRHMDRSPFPGMDPFIEASGHWSDFHDKLIGDTERTLAASLPARYVVRIAERSYIDYVDPVSEIRTGSFEPDVGVRSAFPGGAAEGGAPLGEGGETASATVMHGLIEVERRELFLEILEVDPEERLVTGIEILSPANKRYGSIGWHQYERKRQVFLQGHAHFLELDLLRGGRRLPMQEPWPENPYRLLVMRKEEAPRCLVYPGSFHVPLPEIPVPLMAPDPDSSLALQPLIDGIYSRSRYARSLKYDLPLRPAPNPGEAPRIEEHLAAWRGRDRG